MDDQSDCILVVHSQIRAGAHLALTAAAVITALRQAAPDARQRLLEDALDRLEDAVHQWEDANGATPSHPDREPEVNAWWDRAQQAD